MSSLPQIFTRQVPGEMCFNTSQGPCKTLSSLPCTRDKGFYNTITYPYWVPKIERLLKMFGQIFGKFLGMEVFKALSDFIAFIQHATQKITCIFSPIR